MPLQSAGIALWKRKGVWAFGALLALLLFAGGLLPVGDTIYMMMMSDIFSNEIWALNVSDRSHPYQAGHYTLPNLAGHYPLPAGDFTIDGDQIYLAAGNAGLYLVQVEK